MVAYSIGFGEVQTLGRIGVTEHDMDRLCRQMTAKGSSVSFVDEARPCGYGLQRQLADKGLACMVCAPSLIARSGRASLCKKVNMLQRLQSRVLFTP